LGGEGVILETVALDKVRNRRSSIASMPTEMTPAFENCGAVRQLS
jgi:hypothetical protein